MQNRATRLIASSGTFTSIAFVGLRLLRIDLICIFNAIFIFFRGF